MDENMDLNKQDMNTNENQLKNSMEAVENMDMNKQVFEKDNELESDTEDVLHEFANPNAVIEEVTDGMKHQEHIIRAMKRLVIDIWESHV
ncbi:hypothetical protein Tco_1220019 [Tanacetum coccineum]